LEGNLRRSWGKGSLGGNPVSFFLKEGKKDGEEQISPMKPNSNYFRRGKLSIVAAKRRNMLT